MIRSPLVILLDEPTSGLDPLIRDRVRICLRDHAQRSLIMVTSHSFHEIEGLADQACILVEGKIAMPITPLAQIESLESVYKDSLARAYENQPPTP